MDQETKIHKKRQRESNGSSESSHHVTKAGHVENELRVELHHDVFIDTPTFVEKMFDVDADILEAVYLRSIQGGLYDALRKEWSDFKNLAPTEKALYEPFVKVANFISNACDASTNLTWLSDPKRAPLSLHMKAADFKPDIIMAIGSGEPIPQGGKPAHVPWTRIHVPVEVKKYRGGPSTVIQLAKYLRQCFSECIDRRYVFGLVLTGTRLTVYLADRAGILGSKSFDINEDPKQLIRVIAGLTVFEPSNVGWDPTLTVYDDQNRDSAQFSFQTKCVNHWRMELSEHASKLPDGPIYKAEKFVLWKKIRFGRSEVIKGRATRVWKAWAEKDMALPECDRPVYIIKDTWRDDRRDLEGEFYELIGRHDGIAELHSYCVVRVGGVPDTTSAIRRYVKAVGGPRDITVRQPAKESQDDKAEQEWDYMPNHLVETDCLPTIFDFLEREPQDRTHSRSVLKTYGWSINRAQSLLELVTVMRDAIAGHQHAYNRGVLHRDISEGNILITGKPEFGKRGALIDFDNAIFWKTHQAIMDDQLSGTRPFISAEMLLKSRILSVRGGETGPEVTPIHGLQHDLESFFWVLAHVCIAFDGPTQPREALIVRPGATQEDIRLQQRTNSIFGSNISDYIRGDAKQHIFEASSAYDRSIVQSLSLWTLPLKPLITQFYEILRAAFESDKYDNLYSQVLAAFSETEKGLKAGDPDAIEEERNEKRRALKQSFERLRDQELARRHKDLGGEKRSDLSDEGENTTPYTPPASLAQSRLLPSSPESPVQNREPKRLKRMDR
ncbi:hypothetical protein HWV62_23555 [Athelia sp. TMB]|nr:hypothetical protein HWV62_23555 [Athelia sp. TMB]